MKTFKIEIQEYLSRIIEIEALDIDKAIAKVKEMYRKEEIMYSELPIVNTKYDYLLIDEV